MLNADREQKMISFYIKMPPAGKERPRFSHGNTYTPEKTRNAEELIRWSYKAQHGEFMFPEKTPIAMSIVAVYPVTKSASKKTRAAMLKNEIRPTVLPDWDNIGKLVCDALNGLAYHDDRQIVYASVTKEYGEVPHIRVRMFEMEKGYDVLQM